MPSGSVLPTPGPPGTAEALSEQLMQELQTPATIADPDTITRRKYQPATRGASPNPGGLFIPDFAAVEAAWAAGPPKPPGIPDFVFAGTMLPEAAARVAVPPWNYIDTAV